MLNILQRYTLRCVLKNLLVVWLVLTAVVMTILLGDEMDDLWKYRATLSQSLTYLVCVLPQKTYVILPAVCLMGSLFGMLSLSRHNELSAMFAAGASLHWLAMPVVVVSFFLGALFFYWHEYVAAPLSKYGEQLMMSDIKKRKGIFKDYGLLRGSKNRFLQYGDFNRESSILTDVVLHEMWPNGGGHKLFIRADRAVWDPTAVHPTTGQKGAWRLAAASRDSENYKIIINDDWNTTLLPIESGEILDIEETPEDFGVFERKPIEMSCHELEARIRSLQEAGSSPDQLLPDLEFKRAVPFSVVALIIIGLASGASPFLLGREGAARFTYPLGVCLFILALYYTVSLTCRGMGILGYLPPLVSAWLPNVVFAGVGLWMLARN